MCCAEVVDFVKLHLENGVEDSGVDWPFAVREDADAF